MATAAQPITAPAVIVPAVETTVTAPVKTWGAWAVEKYNGYTAILDKGPFNVSSRFGITADETAAVGICMRVITVAAKVLALLAASVVLLPMAGVSVAYSKIKEKCWSSIRNEANAATPPVVVANTAPAATGAAVVDQQPPVVNQQQPAAAN